MAREASATKVEDGSRSSGSRNGKKPISHLYVLAKRNASLCLDQLLLTLLVLLVLLFGGSLSSNEVIKRCSIILRCICISFGGFKTQKF